VSDPSRHPGQHSWRRRPSSIGSVERVAHEDASAEPYRHHAQREEESGQRTVTRKVLDRSAQRAAPGTDTRRRRAEPVRSLEEVDASGPMHAVAGYRDAVGRAQASTRDEHASQGLGGH
jgi:hypothetical protein